MWDPQRGATPHLGKTDDKHGETPPHLPQWKHRQSHFSSSPVYLRTCLRFRSFLASSIGFQWLLLTFVDVVLTGWTARSLCSGVCLACGTMRSHVHSSLAAWTTSSSGGRRTWSGCKMEEALARRMRHVWYRWAQHPSSPCRLSPLLPLSFTLSPEAPFRRAVAERLLQVSLSPSLSLAKPPDCSACPVQRPELRRRVPLHVRPYVSSSFSSPSPGPQVKTVVALFPSPPLLSDLPSQLPFITSFSSPAPFAPVSAPHSHTCAVFSHIHAHSHTHAHTPLSVSSSLLVDVACFLPEHPHLFFSLTHSRPLSLSHLLSLAAAHTAVPLQPGSRFLVARENISANEKRSPSPAPRPSLLPL